MALKVYTRVVDLADHHAADSTPLARVLCAALLCQIINSYHNPIGLQGKMHHHRDGLVCTYV